MPDAERMVCGRQALGEDSFRKVVLKGQALGAVADAGVMMKMRTIPGGALPELSGRVAAGRPVL
jgi:hypothetical protein